MDHTAKIESIIERYFNGALAEYREAAMAAMTAGKKIPLFRKVDFSGHIQKFQDIKSQAEALLAEADAIEVPESDEMGLELLRALKGSLEDFVELQKRNAAHYDLMDRRQYRKNKVTVDDFRLSLTGVQTGTGRAVESLDLLERTWRYSHGEEVETGKEDEEELEYEDEEIAPEDAKGLNRISEKSEEEIEREERARPTVYGKRVYEEEES